jgi:hypothetical protein
MNGTKNLSIVLLSVVVLMCLTSCTKQIVKFEGDSNTIKQWKKIALVELIIGPPSAPILPLIDAGIYKGAFHKIAPQLLDIHKEKIDLLTEQVGTSLKNAGGVECIFGKQLIAAAGYTEAGIEEKPLTLQNKNFPEATIMIGIKNILDFGSQDFIDNFLDNNKPPAEIMAKIASSLQVDGTVIGIITVPTLNVGAFGLTGTRMAKISLYFFDAQGKFHLKGYASTKPDGSGPGNIEHYVMTLEKSGFLVSDLANAIYQNVK